MPKTRKPIAWLHRCLVPLSLSFAVFLAHACLAPSLAQAQLNWDGAKPVAPGVTHLWKADPAGPWVIHVLRVDLSESSVALETVKAQNRLQGRATTSSLARSNSSPGHRVVGAVNGDFFSGEGVPVGTQVLRGTLLKNPSYRSVFGLTETEKPFISRVSLTAWALTPSGDTLWIQRVNGTRYTDELVAYNRYRGPTTGTNRWGVEYTLVLLDSARVGAPFRGVVTAVDSLHGNNRIPGNGLVLSGHGASRNLLLGKVHLADTLTLFFRLNPLQAPVREALGGLPRIVRNGRISIETGVEGGENFKNVRHPRTAVGFSRDSSTVYLVTVDGRQPGWSVGMTLPELADLLLKLGAWEAMNLDGGGSTTMVVRDSVVNRPSDATGERPVANAILVVSSARPDTLSALDLEPDTLDIPTTASYVFRFDARDRYSNRLDADTLHLTWSCDPAVGSVAQNGLFHSGMAPASGWVRVRCGSVADSTFVRVAAVDTLWLEPPGVGLATGDRCTFRLAALFRRTKGWNYRPDDASWETPGQVAAVVAPGTVEARSRGAGTLHAELPSGQSASARIAVDTSFTVVLESFDRLRGLWGFAGRNVRPWECSARVDSTHSLSPPSAAALRVGFIRTGSTPYVSLKRNLLLGGWPIELSLYLKARTRVAPEVWFVDRSGSDFKLRLTTGTASSGTWRHFAADLAGLLPGWQNPDARADPPFEITELRFYFPGGTYNEHVVDTLFVDDLAATYGKATAVFGGSSAQPSTFRLFPPHPNPFQSTITANLYLAKPGPVSIRVYDVRGRLVWQQNRRFASPGVHRLRWPGFTSDGLPAASGVYLLRVNSGRQCGKAKIALIR